jgi:Holliday junction DNA helicase RuvA
MIAAIRGMLAGRVDDTVVVATGGGVSYEIAVPLSVVETLPAIGLEVYLHTVLVVREDSSSLFGFGSPSDRVLFQRLLGASGVGPRLALSLISALGTDRVVRAVHESDLALLCTVPGVGKKKAERMVLELQDRMRDLEVEDGPEPLPSASEEAIRALVNLGYGRSEADDAVRSAVASNGSAETPDVIRTALQLLAKGK